VVGAGRRPAPGANVTLRLPDRTPLITKADGGGRFVVAAGARPATAVTGGLLATDASGLAGTARVPLAPGAPDVLDVGTIGLAPGAPLEARVVDAGVPVPSVRVFAWLPGVHWGAESTTDAQGLGRFEALPAGVCRLLAIADGSRRSSLWITHPRAEAGPVVLALEPARTIEVIVVDASGHPVPDAAISCSEVVQRLRGIAVAPYSPAVAIPRTDAQGRTAIVGVGPRQTLRVCLWSPGRRPPSPDEPLRNGETTQLAPPGTDVVRFQVPEPAELRWTAGSGGAPVPTEGTVLVVESLREGRGPEVSGEARIEGGELVVRTRTPLAQFRARMVAPDGSFAEVYGDLRAMSPLALFHPSRKLEVEVRDEQGRRLEGVTLRAHVGGFIWSGPTAWTDAEGKARFERLSAGNARVTLVEGSDLRGVPRVLGSADLRNGDQRIELEVPSERDVILRVSLEGRPALPSAYTVTADRRQIDAVTDDPEQAELRFRARPAMPTKPIEVTLETPGFAAQPVLAQTAEPGGTLRAAIDLRPAGTLAIHVLESPENQEAPRLTLEKRRDTDGAWVDDNRHLYVPIDGNGATTVTGLETGRYRVREAMSGALSDEAEVTAGGAIVEVRLDLRRSGFAEGRIEAPEGTAMTDVRVVVEGAETASNDDVVRSDGTFRVRVPGDRVVRLRPSHPLLAPAEPDGCASLQAGRSGLVLRLVAGPTARFRVPALSGARPEVRVLLFESAVGPAPVRELPAALEQGVARFGGFAPGAWVAWFDLPGWAPVVRSVELGGDAETDLGEVRASPGSTLRVEAGSDQTLQAVHVLALDPPKYRRVGASDGGGGMVVTGLGAGRFRAVIVSSSKTGGAMQFERTFEADGRLPVTIRAER
jgi:hypothetical protein